MITPTTRAKPGTNNFFTAAKNAKFSDKNYQAPAFPPRPLHESLYLFFPRNSAKPQRIARIAEKPITHQLPTPIFLGALGDLAVQHFHHPHRFPQAKIKSHPHPTIHPLHAPSRPLHESLQLFFPRNGAKPQRIARITEEPITHQLPTPIFLGALGDLAVQHFHHPHRFPQAKIKSHPPPHHPPTPRPFATFARIPLLIFPAQSRKAAKPQGSQRNPSPISFPHLSSLALLATWRFNIFIIPTDFPKQR